MAAKGLPRVVSEKQFRAAVEKFRKKEKKETRARDRLAAERRRLPMVEVKNYVFDSPQGKVSLLDLFDGRKQLMLYHFMYHPKTDSFCKGCSFFGDQVPELAHIQARNTTFAMVSQAPVKSIQRHQKKLGWKYNWVSSLNNELNHDFGIDGNTYHEMSVFIRDGKKIYRTYYTTDRGLEYVGTVWSFLDLTPYGRQELWEDTPKGRPQTKPFVWWKFHDEY